MRPRTRAPRDTGYVTPAFVATVGCTMILLVTVANLLVLRYADGILQSAVEEGVRQGLATGEAASCAARAAEVVEAGLGPMTAGVAPAVCTIAADGATAGVTATFPGWLPLVPTHDTAATARRTGLVAD